MNVPIFKPMKWKSIFPLALWERGQGVRDSALLRSIGLIFILLMTTLTGFAQGTYVIDVVCVGAERHYRIDGDTNTVYTWQLTDEGGLVTTLPETADTVTIIWNVPIGTYWLSAIQHDTVTGCDGLLEVGTIEVIDGPVAYAGDPVMLCQPFPYRLETDSAANHSSLAWTSSGDGTFDDPTALHPVYTFGANDIAAGSVTLTLTAQGLGYTGSCPPAVSSVIITLDNLMVESLITPASCPAVSDGTVLLSASGGTLLYTYTMNSITITDTTALFTGLAAGTYIYTVSDASGCTITDSLRVPLLPALAATYEYTDELWAGAANGTITVHATGGSGIYEYSIIPPSPQVWQSDSLFTGLAIGFYDIYVRDSLAPDCWIYVGRVEIGTSPGLIAEYTFTNTTCFGYNDGTITFFNAQNGTGFYEFSINAGITWQSDTVFTGLMPGIYTLRLRDSIYPQNWETIGQVEILGSQPLSASVTVIGESAVGAGDGEIHITGPTGGSGVYEYSIDGVNWQSSPDFTGLAPGSYDVYMRDATYPYCWLILETTVVPAADQLFAQFTFTNITCFEANDGTITIYNQTGGSGGYEYSLDGTTWQSDSVFTGLAPGTYNVIMRDSALITNTVTIGPIILTEPAILAADVTFTPETCDSLATITVSNSTGGSGIYEYSITGFTWQSDTIFTDLDGGFPYMVFIRDSLNPLCQVTLGTFFIPVDCPLNATLDITDVTCFGGNDGSITVIDEEGGSGFYEYSIDGGATWQNGDIFAGLTAGPYIIIMRDQLDTTQSINLNGIVNQPAQMTADITVIPAGCDFGGTITISNPTGGSGGYEFSIDSIAWQSGLVFTDMPGGIYNVYMRDEDNNSCVSLIETVVVIVDCPVTASVDSIPISCYNFTNGTAMVVNPEGGSGIYEYSIDSINWQSSNIFTPLGPGTYTLYVRDSLNITNVAIAGVVTLQNPAEMTATVVISHETIPFASDGFITITNPTGGSGTYEYSMDETNWQASNVFGPLAPGMYNIWMRDAADTLCYVYLGLFRVLPASELYAQFLVQMVTCTGSSDGILNVVNPNGGSGVYEYSLDSITWQTDSTFTGLAAGWYSVWIRDLNTPGNVTRLPDQEVTEPQPLAAQLDVLDVSCHSAGSITFINVTGGYGAYQYSIDSGMTWHNDSIFINLQAGTYMAMLRDSLYQTCFSYIDTLTIEQATGFDITVRVASAACGNNNGAISVTASGGTGALEYQLLSGTTVIVPWNSYYVFNNLAPGNYTVKVRDEAGCIGTLASVVVMSQPGPEISEVEVWNAVNNLPNAHIIIHASGGTPPLLYSLNKITWLPSNTFENLAPGMGFTAYVMDANGCMDSLTYNIGNVVLGVIELISGRVTECVGTLTPLDISVINFDSVASFHLQLSFNPDIFSFQGFGGYHNNIYESQVIATEISPGNLDIHYTHPQGVISIPDGQMMLQLLFEGVTPGLTELNWKFLECTVYTSIGFVEPITAVVNGMAEIIANPAFEAFFDGMYCSGDSTLLYTTANNIETLTFEWTHPRGIKHFGSSWPLGPLTTMDDGNYVVQAFSEQCYSRDTVNITVFPQPEVYISYSDTLCFGNPVVLDPGDDFTQYEWNDGTTMPTLIAYEAGTYWVKVVDINGCRAADSVELVPCIIEVLIPNAFTPNNDGLNDVFRPLFSGFEPGNYRMDIFSKWGQLLFTTSDVGRGWDGRVNGELVPPDTFVYIISYEVPSYVLRKGLSSPITGRVSVIR